MISRINFATTQQYQQKPAFNGVFAKVKKYFEPKFCTPAEIAERLKKVNLDDSDERQSFLNSIDHEPLETLKSTNELLKGHKSQDIMNTVVKLKAGEKAK